MAMREITFYVPQSSWISLTSIAAQHGYSVEEFCREASLEKMRELDAEDRGE